MIKKTYTLVEMICYMSILAVLMNLAMLLFHDGIRICSSAIKDAEMNEEVLLLRGKWRNFVDSCEAKFIIREDGSLSSSGALAKHEGRKLILTRSDSERRLFLPEGTEFSFKIEKNGEDPENVILYISRGKNFKRRIVAVHGKK